MATAPTFIPNDPQAIVSEMIAFYENETGKKLQPAQVEQLIINMASYRESVLRNQFNLAARGMLVNYAIGAMLDELAALVGVTRLPATVAEVTIRFEVNTGATVTIPQFTRVASKDGTAIFRTKADTTITPSMTVADVVCESEVAGSAYNGYAIGTITEIMDPVPFVTAASNMDVSAGGADIETDDHFRDRIKLAPNQFSVAGSRDSYKYWAFTAHPNIIDVDITSPSAGIVRIYVLGKNGDTPTEILDAVETVCNGDKIRPLTDTVQVMAAVPIDINIEVYINPLTTYSVSDVQDRVTAALEALKADREAKMGLDLRLSRLIATCMVEGVYDVTIANPTSDTDVDPGQVIRVSAINVNMSDPFDP